jgi:hypothetical protein
MPSHRTNSPCVQDVGKISLVCSNVFFSSFFFGAGRPVRSGSVFFGPASPLEPGFLGFYYRSGGWGRGRPGGAAQRAAGGVGVGGVGGGGWGCGRWGAAWRGRRGASVGHGARRGKGGGGLLPFIHARWLLWRGELAGPGRTAPAALAEEPAKSSSAPSPSSAS